MGKSIAQGDSLLEGVFEGDGAVEDGDAGLGGMDVRGEVADALELVVLAGEGLGEGRFDVGGDDLHALGVDGVQEVAGGRGHRVFEGEEAVVEADLGGLGVLGADPVDGAADLAAIGGVAAHGGGVVGAVDFGDGALGVLDQVGASEEAGAAEAHFVAGGEAVELLGGHLHEVVTVDPEFVGAAEFAGAGVGVFGVVGRVGDELGVLGQVVDDQLDGVEDGHAAGSDAVEVVADAPLEEGEVGEGFVLGDAGALAEIADGGGGVAAAAHTGDGGHAGVVPAIDVAFLDELTQEALAHHGVGEVEAGELALLRADGLAVTDDQTALLGQTVDDPIIEGAVNLELQRAHGVGDALERVLDGVGEVVHRVAMPGGAGAIVRQVDDAVDDGVAEVDVGRGHVNLGAEAALALGNLTGAHLAEEREALLGGAVAPGGGAAGFGGHAAIGFPLFLGEFADVGLAAADEFLGDGPHLIETVAGVEEGIPLVAQPLDVALELLHEVLGLLGGVRVVHAQVATAVGLRRETRHHRAIVLAGGQIRLNPLPQKVPRRVQFRALGAFVRFVLHGGKVLCWRELYQRSCGNFQNVP